MFFLTDGEISLRTEQQKMEFTPWKFFTASLPLKHFFFGIFTPEPWGRCSNVTDAHIFQVGGEPTTKQKTYGLSLSSLVTLGLAVI